jgi:hypothetical protein
MAGQVWAVSSLGGFLYSRQLSNVLRMAVQPLVKFRQFADVHDISQQGKKKGDTFTWDVISDVATVGTVLVETNTLPETNFTITQGTLTITEAGNSVPYSGKLDNLSKFPVEDIIKKALKNDTVKALDRLAWQQFNPAGHWFHHQRYRLWHQQRRVQLRSCEGHRGLYEGAQHPGLHRGRLLRDCLADDAADLQEQLGDHPPVQRHGLQSHHER